MLNNKLLGWLLVWLNIFLISCVSTDKLDNNNDQKKIWRPSRTDILLNRGMHPASTPDRPELELLFNKKK